MHVREYQLLLELSRAITMVRDGEALLRVMMEQVRPLFGFDDAGILVLDAVGEHHRDLLVGHPSVMPTEATRRVAAAGLGGWLPHHGSMIEAHMHACKAANAPLVFAFDDMLREFPEYPFHPLIKDLGYQEVLATLLRVRGDSFGILYFISVEHHHFRPQQFALFEAIADQIAIAVRNILANEEITALAEERRLRADVLAKANDALQHAAEDLAVARTVEDIYGVFLLQAAAISDATGGAVLQRSGLSGTRFEFVAVLDQGDVIVGERLHTMPMVAAMPMYSEQDPTGHFARLAQGHTVLSPLDDLQHILPEGAAWVQTSGNHAALSVPFTLHGNVQGYLGLPLRDERAPSSVVRETLNALANQIAIALDLVRLADEAKRAAVAVERETAAQERAAELATANDALRDSIEQLSGLDNVDAFLGAMLNAACAATGAACGAILLFDMALTQAKMRIMVQDGHISDIEREPGLAFWRRTFALSEPGWADMVQLICRTPGFGWMVVDDPDMVPDITAWHREWQYRSVAHFPLRRGNQLLGSLALAFRTPQRPSAAYLEMVGVLAQQAALALELTRLSDMARRDAEQAATLKERTRIAREMHDTLAQAFTGVIVQLEAARRAVDDDPAAAGSHMLRAGALARDGLAEARRAVQALGPRALEDGDLVAALGQVVHQLHDTDGPTITYTVVGAVLRLPAEDEGHVFRIAQEALTNAVRHAAATAIALRVEIGTPPTPGQAAVPQFVVQVDDDGVGFDLQHALTNGGWGVRGMYDRAARIGAHLDVRSRPGAGTRITVTVPVRPRL
jgi:signal transduction histidine kinase